MYGTASVAKHDLVRALGGIPIDYQQVDFVEDVLARTAGAGVDAVFDGIGGSHLWRSYQAVKRGGIVVAFGHATGAVKRTLVGGWLRGLPTIAAYIARSALTPDGKRMALYSIQTLKRQRPDWFHEDLTTLFHLLAAGQIAPVIAAQLPLDEAAQAHEMVGDGVHGRVVLLCDT
jgi:NADPH2:quinone reductase